jgi:putative membrane protein
MYEGYHFWGMHLIWWFIWGFILMWIFTIPYAIPGQRWQRNSSLDILQQRFATGEISVEEYKERKKILSID